MTESSREEMSQFKTISFKVPSQKKSRFFMVISVNQLILLVEQMYMLNLHYNLDVFDPQVIDFVRIAAQHLTMILVLIVVIYFLQTELVWRKKSYA